MKAMVQMVKEVKGFVGTTYAVWQGTRCVKIFLDKKEAEIFADALNEKEDVR